MSHPSRVPPNSFNRAYWGGPSDPSLHTGSSQPTQHPHLSAPQAHPQFGGLAPYQSHAAMGQGGHFPSAPGPSQFPTRPPMGQPHPYFSQGAYPAYPITPPHVMPPAGAVPAQITNITPPGGYFVPLQSAQSQLHTVPPQRVYNVQLQHQGLHLTACADACMNMVSSYYGRPTAPLPHVWQRPSGLSMDEVKTEMQQRGFSANTVNLLSATRRNGLTSDQLLGILTTAGGPLIAGTERHAFVITGVVGDTVYVQDPLWPRKQITIGELNRKLDFTDPDVLLSFRPNGP